MDHTPLIDSFLKELLHFLILLRIEESLCLNHKTVYLLEEILLGIDVESLR